MQRTLIYFHISLFTRIISYEFCDVCFQWSYTLRLSVHEKYIEKLFQHTTIEKERAKKR